ncbi:MAG: GNAT family N-acetyltransferase [Candidatus Kariarchaeaceae archaeon]|jgi:GNAT superfamily N-acetyltransferase
MTEWKNKNNFLITTNKNAINLIALHDYLSEIAYWSKGIPLNIVKKAIDNSICFSILSPENEFIGFARVVTDIATFGYLTDVFVIDEFKRQGLGKWLVKTIMEFPDFKRMRSWFLYTKDAHSLYEKFGWERLKTLDRAMVKKITAEELYGTLTSSPNQDQITENEINEE